MTTRTAHIRRARRSPLVVLAVGCALAVSACGSTRYVVVQNGSAGAAVATTAAPSGPISADDQKAIEKAVDGALGLDDRPFAERAGYLDGADDLGDTYASVLKLVKDLDASLRIDKVVADGDEATATVTVVVSGAEFAAGVPVELVRVDDAWKVTRSGACAALAIGSPCPDE
ncbi:hypothetical protein [Aquihabitans sp. McL0605]|uniref:hypothetical protein n=1 Tax=Aquihabitans sp. McL0605 TaxID=3415671 RepID=UPI003CFB0C87